MRAPLVVSLVAALALSACGPTIDLTKGLQVLDVSTGWKDAGVQDDGMNKLIPTLSFKLKNVSDQPLRNLQVNAVFKPAGTDQEFGAEFLIVTQSDALQPGAETAVLNTKPLKGYTGIESRAEMLKNSHFVDGEAQLFAKYSSTQWVKIGDYTVERRLLAP